MTKLKLQNILECNKEYLKEWSFTSWHLRTLHALRTCRTAALGGHIDQCNCCNKLHLSYNSCRNRHCPNCQGHKREQWITARESELLNCEYYHMVFTLPSELHKVALHHPAKVYASLFKAAWQTLKSFAQNTLNVTPGMIGVLHTWGQNLSLHPHLHCIVPQGGIDENKRWKKPKNRKHVYPVKAMSVMFRAKMVALLRQEKLDIPQSTFDLLFSKKWVIYAKESFKNPKYVIQYLGRYSHRVALSNARLVKHDTTENVVYFNAKNYRKNGQKELLKLKAKDFIKRFQLHILPKGFTRIRHYGVLSSTLKSKHLEELQQQLQEEVLPIEIPQTPNKHLKCPYCKKGDLVTLVVFGSRGPPKQWVEIIKNQNSAK